MFSKRKTSGIEISKRRNLGGYFLGRSELSKGGLSFLKENKWSLEVNKF